MPRALILVPQRRSMVSSSPITTGAPDGTKAFTSTISSWRATALDDHAARLRIRWKVQKSGSHSRPRMRSAAATVGERGIVGHRRILLDAIALLRGDGGAKAPPA